MMNLRKRDLKGLLAAVCAAALLIWPRIGSAGIRELAAGAVHWWNAHSVGELQSSGEEDVTPAEDEDGADQADDEEETPSTESQDGDDGESSDAQSGSTSGTPGMCLVPQEPPKTECAVGSGFLCVTTPPGSVAGSELMLTGTIDRQGSTLANMQIVAQNDYTKSMSSVATSTFATSGCDSNGTFEGDFCLDADGRFAARVALPEDGPYTIMVTASQLTGDSVTKQARTSRVIPTSFTKDDVELNPDVMQGQGVDGSHLTVTVDLLGECQFCDFIGASTGGVAVTVENVITGGDGVEKSVSCATTTEQGGQGRFVLGVPLGSGKNSITIRACNAAAQGAACPQVSGIEFDASSVVDVSDAVEFISPPAQPSYSRAEYPIIPWKFKIAGGSDCISVRLNREAPTSVCRGSSDGVYSVDLAPREGINVVTIQSESGADEFAWTFGWGEIVSPHAGAGGKIEVPSALEVGLTSKALRELIVPAVNNYLSSDEFVTMIDEVLSGMGGEGAGETVFDEDASTDTSSAESIPKCSAGGGGSFETKLRGTPVLGEVFIKTPQFANGMMELSVVMKDVEVGLDVIPEKDLPPLPLLISFRKAVLDVDLLTEQAEDGRPLVLVSSPHEDCDYKSGTYCKHIPAALIPKNIVGGANSYGGFLKCDMSLATGKAKEACAAINSLNAQTGVLSEVVLDAVNEALYCGGSAALTGAAREGVRIPPIEVGCANGDVCEGVAGILPRVSIPLNLMLDGGLGLSTDGLLARLALSFGDAATYEHTPEAAKVGSAGIIAGEGFGLDVMSNPSSLGGELGAALSFDAVNALLFAASAQGDGRDHLGILDIDIHEPFFQRLGFDFVEECDAYEVPAGGEDDRSTLCQIRPRVSELLGTALTTYGYLKGNHPLMLSVRGNRALGIRLSVADIDDLPVVIQDEGMSGEEVSDPTGSLVGVDIGGLTLTFYALEVDDSAGLDEYGNPSVAIGSDGEPVIMPMGSEGGDPRDGYIISFDLTLMLALELGEIVPDPKDGSSSVLKLGILGDRTRLVLTPVPGTNSTTVPSAGLVSALAEKLKYAMVAMGEFALPVPREFAFAPDDQGLFGMLGLAKIDFGADGLSLEFDSERNKALLALSAAITQVLHKDGVEKSYDLP